jgi:hypothetical protein
VRTRVRILPPNAEGDSDLYDFKYKSELVSKELNIAASVPVNDLDLMKAMIRGHTVSGYKKTSPSLEVSTGTKHVKATLEAMWKGRGAFIGYQFRIENSTNNQEYQMDLRRLNIGSPNLAVLSQVDDPIIVGQNRKGPKQTRLRIVAKPSSSTSDVVLPVQWLKRGGK